MKYFRCKCGKHEAWSSMGVPECSGCDTCGTTLEQNPEDHREPIPHEWQRTETRTQRHGEEPVATVTVQCSRCRTKRHDPVTQDEWEAALHTYDTPAAFAAWYRDKWLSPSTGEGKDV